ncbi:MAG: hypothetical protein NWF01_04270 [Candidatus Bathyarchaeota archaeon]|nr:hypothetical protein [Candidatus Bathyarchaeota archaeon]
MPIKWESTHSAPVGLPEVFLMPDNQRYIVAPNGRLFCVDSGEYYRKGRFTKKQKRHYMRLHSGMKLASSRKERLTFMTLTTRYEKTNRKNRFAKVKMLNNAFIVLRKRIERLLQKRMYMQFCRKHYSAKEFYRNKKGTVIYGYELHGDKLAVKYPFDFAMFKFKFRYFKVKTAEGGGVLHVIFRKAHNVPPIPFKWLQEQWDELWNSPRVNIKDVPITSARGLSMYMVGQYYAKQPVIRMSYGRQWVYQGFKKSFNHIAEIYGSMRQPKNDPYEPPKITPWKRVLEVWDKKMKNNDLPTIAGTSQKRFRFHKWDDCYYENRRLIKKPPTKTIPHPITKQPVEVVEHKLFNPNPFQKKVKPVQTMQSTFEFVEIEDKHWWENGKYCYSLCTVLSLKNSEKQWILANVEPPDRQYRIIPMDAELKKRKDQEEKEAKTRLEKLYNF